MDCLFVMLAKGWVRMGEEWMYWDQLRKVEVSFIHNRQKMRERMRTLITFSFPSN